MCEMYAVDSASPVDATEELVAFFARSVEQPHGWGLAERAIDSAEPSLIKGPERAIDSQELACRLASPVTGRQIAAHIRYATRGARSRENSQPVMGSAAGARWIVMHNGTLFSEGPAARYAEIQKGESDSERLALFLLDQLAAATTCAARCAALEQAIAAVCEGNKVNLILDDGEATYAHTNVLGATLHMREEPGTLTLCTQPIGAGEDSGAPWRELERGRLYAWKSGERIHTGEPHGLLYDDPYHPA